MERKRQDDAATTPPCYMGALPPTRPSTSEKASISPILEAVDRYKRGQFVPGGRLLKFHISELEYQELEEKLSEDLFFKAKISRDYFPSLRLFVLRIPSDIHERFLVRLHDEIRHQLRNLEGPSSSFAQEIEFIASTTFNPTRKGLGVHDPDGSFRHRSQRFPGVVTEVAYSQDHKKLPHLADEYILGSNLRVRALLGFDIQYKRKQALVSVWRPHAVQRDDREVWATAAETQVFRDDNGEPNLDPHAGLRVSLRDFASVEFCKKFENLEGSIFISCATLCTFLNEAEAKIDDESESEPDLELEFHASSSEEELNTDDERDMVRAEKHAEEKTDRADPSFK
ncbi:hypothetical protein FOPE_10546 [Fonsecaea pedrosoi]|nr:hypothetical protein FOPE_10546 [Fonsecaea pedrosoi]